MIDYYSAEYDRSMLRRDPAQATEWPITATEARLLSKDAGTNPLAEHTTFFLHNMGTAS